MNKFLVRAMRGNFDLRDPDNAPGMVELLDKAQTALDRRNAESAPRWNILASKLKATDIINMIRNTGLVTQKDYTVSFRFKGGRVTDFRNELSLKFDRRLNSEDRNSIATLWKTKGISLYGRDFFTSGEFTYQEGSFNCVNIGYYGSLAGAEGLKRMSLILKTVTYVRKLPK
jgi:hypothetical protein